MQSLYYRRDRNDCNKCLIIIIIIICVRVNRGHTQANRFIHEFREILFKHETTGPLIKRLLEFGFGS